MDIRTFAGLMALPRRYVATLVEYEKSLARIHAIMPAPAVSDADLRAAIKRLHERTRQSGIRWSPARIAAGIFDRLQRGASFPCAVSYVSMRIARDEFLYRRGLIE